MEEERTERIGARKKVSQGSGERLNGRREGEGNWGETKNKPRYRERLIGRREGEGNWGEEKSEPGRLGRD